MKCGIQAGAEVGRSFRGLQFDHKAAVARPVNHAVEGPGWAAKLAAHGHRHRMQRPIEMWQDFQEKVAVQFRQRTADDGGNLQPRARVGASLNDHIVGFPHHEQHAVGLDRSR